MTRPPRASSLPLLLLLLLLSLGGVVAATGGGVGEPTCPFVGAQEDAATLPPQELHSRWERLLNRSDADGAATHHTPTGTFLELEEEPSEEGESQALFFFTVTLMACILLTYVVLTCQCHWIPESVVVILLGVLVGGILKLLHATVAVDNLMRVQPNTLLLLIVPPIIFDSGYSLHKGDFFRNIGSILMYAILGTIISSVVVGLGMYLGGLLFLSHKLSLVESFAFGALISSVDPVATLAIFKALNVNKTLHMLVFGESVMNDAVAITLFRTLVGFMSLSSSSTATYATILSAFGHFALVFFGSVLIGVMIGLIAACIFKYTRIRSYSSLEISLLFLLAYLPYVVAEALLLSGIMAILVCGIVMSHYTYFNLSAFSQVTSQQTFRMFAYLAETLVFVDLGLSIFTFNHVFSFSIIFWGFVMVLLGRLLNIFPISMVINSCQKNQIDMKNQVIMWFSGLRGAISFALVLNLPSANQNVLVTSTLVIVLLSIVLLGGGTMPLLKILQVERSDSHIILSKTAEMSDPLDGEVPDSSLEEDERQHDQASNWFSHFDQQYLQPIFRREGNSLLPENIEMEMHALERSVKRDRNRPSSMAYRQLLEGGVESDSDGGSDVDSALRVPGVETAYRTMLSSPAAADAGRLRRMGNGEESSTGVGRSPADMLEGRGGGEGGSRGTRGRNGKGGRFPVVVSSTTVPTVPTVASTENSPPRSLGPRHSGRPTPQSESPL